MLPQQSPSLVDNRLDHSFPGGDGKSRHDGRLRARSGETTMSGADSFRSVEVTDCHQSLETGALLTPAARSSFAISSANQFHTSLSVREYAHQKRSS